MPKYRWRAIIHRYLLPKMPPGVIYWRYMTHKKDTAISLHRRALTARLTQSPISLHLALSLYSLLFWFLFQGWYQSFRSLRRWGKRTKQRENVPLFKQLADLLVLTFVYTIPARDYYRYKLYTRPRDQWLLFIYTHELPHWHRMLSPNISRQSHELISDKHKFSQLGLQHDLPTIPTSIYFQRGQTIDDHLFCQQSLFLKPTRGSRKHGCMILRYDHHNDDYTLSCSEGQQRSKLLIKKELRKYLEQSDYIAQALLINSGWLRERAPNDELIILRLITARNKDGPTCLCAVLEVPISNDIIHPLNVELESGKLQSVDSSWQDDTLPNENTHAENKPHQLRCHIENSLLGLQLPDWDDAKHIVKNAHRYFNDISTIGWDLAFTDKGVKLLEGNFNWSVMPHQLNGPTLLPKFAALLGERDGEKSSTGSPFASR